MSLSQSFSTNRLSHIEGHMWLASSGSDEGRKSFIQNEPIVGCEKNELNIKIW